MSRRPETPSSLVSAAEQLEAEMRRCEEALADGDKLRLTSGKNVSRAARALQAAAEGHASLGARVSALLHAITEVRERADGAARRMEARAAEIRGRQERLQALQDRTGEIAAAVRDVTEFAKSHRPADVLPRLAPVQDQVAGLIEASRRESFEDVTHDLDALRQMLESIAKKLVDLRS